MTFRLRRWYRNLGLGGLLGYLAWSSLAIFGMLNTPEIKHPVAAAALMGGIPLFMAGLSGWILAAYWRGCQQTPTRFVFSDSC
jgi:hypothetical protein